MDVVYAKHSAQVMTPDGGRWNVQAGQHWPAGDPVVEAMPGMFSADARYGVTFSAAPPELSEEPVEQATAGPGEKRNVRRGGGA
jgi:hypothetical protein